MIDAQVVLFDVDGVLAQPPKLFSEIYSNEYGVDINELQPFYKSDDFKDAILGKADLKELIIKHSDKWHWHKDPQILLDMWFKGEHVVNTELLIIVNRLRDRGIPVYLATQQEKYRAKYINNIMFSNKFDGSFVSCDIGHTKQEPEYWNYILEKLNKYGSKNIYFFDDTQSCVDAAKLAGINSFLYNSVEQVSTILAT